MGIRVPRSQVCTGCRETSGAPCDLEAFAYAVACRPSKTCQASGAGGGRLACSEAAASGLVPEPKSVLAPGGQDAQAGPS